MNEENKFGPKNKWTRIFRKKWFFPSLYLMLAALLISAVVWYQNTGNEETQPVDESLDQTEDYVPVPNDEDAVPVLEEQEVIQMPVASPEEAEIVTKFFDYDAEQSDKANALIHYNNRYYQSTGVDIASADAESFDVVAALSGTVTEVKTDPLMGNVVVVTHDNDVKTYYASLDEVSVEADAEVKQGDVIGTAGNNIFGKDKGTHVHFELQQGDTKMNPEDYFNQPVASLGSASDTSDEEAEETEETEEAEETDPVDSPEEDAEVEEDEDVQDEDAESDDEAIENEENESDE